MRSASAQAPVALEPAAALALWVDTGRWPTFVEGFGHTASLARDWPREGASHVWESRPGGRGRVTERVLQTGASSLKVQLFEERLTGEQTVIFEPREEGSLMELRLDYELSQGGPLRAVADALFIRRALRDALRRTVQRFAVEAEDEAGLR
ncbi:MAG TPA: SRPBCC family protein [Thermoleophilaceae bacterium]|nr:SRPBCC family protein [Thermoleophilaceae bacterium]